MTMSSIVTVCTPGCADDPSEPDGGAGGSRATSGSSQASVTGSTTTGGRPDEIMPSFFSERCPAAATWPIACMTMSSPGVIGFDPQSMESCVVADLGTGLAVNSFAVVGDTIIGCPELTGFAYRVDVRTGERETARVERCSAITDANDVLFVQLFTQGVATAPSFDSVIAGQLAPTAMNPRAERLGARNADLYAAWHVTNVLEHWDIPSGTRLPDVPLQDFDGWVEGIAPLDDGRILVLSREELVAFSSTGERLFSTPPPDFARKSLRCYTN